LFSKIYDIVIELDEHLKIVGGRAEALAGYLLHGPNRQLEGSLFQDFMFDSDDKAEFESHLKQGRSTPNAGQLNSESLAIPVRLRMRDSLGNALRVELLHAEFLDLNLKVHYLIGLRDITDISDGLPLDDANLTPLLPPAPAIIGASRQNSKGGLRSRGTPAMPLNGSFMSSSSGTSAVSQLMRPDFRATRPLGVRASLAQVLIRWNLDRTNSWCCSWHLLVYVAMSNLRQMQRQACFDSHELVSEWQCPRCGMMDNSASEAEYSYNTQTCKWCLNLSLDELVTDEIDQVARELISI
ncbi:unnamed protein product, partial [Polarella glacialis]